MQCVSASQSASLEPDESILPTHAERRRPSRQAKDEANRKIAENVTEMAAENVDIDDDAELDQAMLDVSLSKYGEEEVASRSVPTF